MRKLKSKGCDSFRASVCLFIVLISTSGWTGGFADMTEQCGSDKEEIKQASEAANFFIKRFRETLDFATAFNEMAVPDAVRRLGKDKLADLLDLDRQFAATVADATLNRAYMASMNFTYLRAVYYAGLEYSGEMDEERAPLPSEIKLALKQSKHLRNLVSDGVEDSLLVNTQQDLSQYITDLEQIAALFKKYLPRDVFNSTAYKANIKSLEKNRDEAIAVECGNDYFNIKDNERVYVVRKDLFRIYFIRAHGSARILGFGLGN